MAPSSMGVGPLRSEERDEEGKDEREDEGKKDEREEGGLVERETVLRAFSQAWARA